jgi:ubiquinone/menaquinone biosynthesis C-methylase UbiE
MSDKVALPIWQAIGRQLQCPSGEVGSVAGLVMRIVNVGPNRLSVDTLQIEPEDTILELGFGPGHGLKLLASRAKAGMVHGVDLSPVMLEQATLRNRTAIRAGRVVLHRSGFDAVPLADASVNKVLAVNVIYFWHDAARVLCEIRRVLRPGGRLVIYATDAATMRRWKFAGEDTHRHWTRNDLLAALCGAGFAPRAIAVREVTLVGGVHGLIATASTALAG